MPKYMRVDLAKVNKGRLSEDVYYQNILTQMETNKQSNSILYKETVNLYVQMRELAAKVYGVTSKQYRYVINNPVEPPPTFKNDFKKLDSMRENAIARDKTRQQDRDYRRRAKVAVDDLIAAGFIEWQEFNPMRPMTERKRLMQQIEGVWTRRDPESESK